MNTAAPASPVEDRHFEVYVPGANETFGPLSDPAAG